MNIIYLATGTNLGNRANNLELAISAISLEIGLIQKRSSIYQTTAWGLQNQADFYNQVLCVNTKLEPIDLLKKCQEIEKKMGRNQTTHWGPRVIDIDILFFNNSIIQKDQLTIPHPHLHNRNFVMIPLCEIAKELVHPVFQKTIFTLLSESTDKLKVAQLEFSK